MGSGISKSEQAVKTSDNIRKICHQRHHSAGDANSLNCSKVSYGDLAKGGSGNAKSCSKIVENESESAFKKEEVDDIPESLSVQDLEEMDCGTMNVQEGPRPLASNSFCNLEDSDGENSSMQNFCFSSSLIRSPGSGVNPRTGNVRSEESILRELRSEGMLLALKGARTKSWDRRGQQIIRELKDTGLLGQMEAEHLIAQEKRAMPRRLSELKIDERQGTSADHDEYSPSFGAAVSSLHGEVTPNEVNRNTSAVDNVETLEPGYFGKPLPPIFQAGSNSQHVVIDKLHNLELQ